MNYIILFISLITGSTSFAMECGYSKDWPVQERMDKTFMDTYHSEYAFAHIFCRKKQCFRAYDLVVTDTGGDPDTGRVEETLTSISCTDDRDVSFWEKITSPIVASSLSANFEVMKKKPVNHGGLPLIEHISGRRGSSNIESTTPSPSAID